MVPTTLFKAWTFLTMYHVISVNGEGPLCFACEKIAKAADCPTVVRCSENEICYSQRVIGSNLNEFYRLGCTDKDLCRQKEFSLFGGGGSFASAIGKKRIIPAADAHARAPYAPHALARRQAQNEMLLCLQCCDSDNCNDRSCGSHSTTGLKKCFECKNVDKPQDCDQVVECGNDHMCYVHRGPTHVTFEYRYDLGCMPTRQCQTAMTVYQNTGCMVCCDDRSYCNLNACDHYKPPINITSTTEAATTPTTTTTSTTTTTTTTAPTTTTTEKAPTITINPGQQITRPYLQPVTATCKTDIGTASWGYGSHGSTLPTGAHANGDTLTIDSLNEKNKGTYKCVVVSPLGTITTERIHVHIQTIPAVAVQVTLESNGPLHPNDKFALRCTVLGYPAPTVTWEFENAQGAQTVPSSVQYTSNDRVLTIQHYDPAKHDGKWTCKANNGFGDSTATNRVPH